MANIEAGTVLWRLDVDSSGFDAQVKKAQRSVSDFGDDVDRQSSRAKAAFGDIAKGVLAFVGVTSVLEAVKNATVDAVNAFGQFESNLGVLGAVTRATNPQLAQLKELAVALGNDLSLPGVSASDAAEAMLELGKAGINVNDILGASKAVLQAAKAGNIGVAESAAIVSQALNAFKLNGNEAIKVADLLAGAANASSFDIDQLGLALAQSSAAARIAKVPLNDTVTALAALGNAGLQASDAGTSLKSFFLNIKPTSKPAIAAMDELKLSFFDASGQFVGLREASRRLQGALKGLSEEQKLASLNTIFGSDAIRSATILSELGADGFDKLSEAVNRQGAAADLAAARNTGIKGSLDALKSAIDTALLGFGEFLSKGLKPLVDAAAGNLPVALAAVAAGIAAIGIAAAVALVGVGGLVAGLAALAAITGIGLLAAAVAGAIVLLQQNFDIFGKIAGAVAKAFEIMKQDAEESLKFVVDIFDNTRFAIGDAAEAIIGFFQAIPSAITSAFETARKVITEKLDAIKNFFTGVFDAINKALEPWRRDFIGTLGSVLGDAINALIKYDVDVLLRWKNNLDNIIKLAEEWGGKIVKAIGDALTTSFTALGKWGADFVKGVGDTLSAAFAAMGKFVEEFPQKFSEAFNKVVENSLKWGSDFIKNVGDSFTRTIDAAKKWATDLFTNMGTALDNVGKAIVDFFTKLPQNIGDFLNNTGKTLTDKTTTGMENAFKAQETLKKIGLAIIAVLVLIPVSIAIALIDLGFTLVAKIVEGIVGAIRFIVEKGPDIVRGLAKGIGDAVGIAVAKAGEVVNAIANAIRSGFNSFVDAGRNLITGLAKGIGDGVSSAVNAAKNAAGNVLNSVKNFFGIKSPSKVMAEQGDFLMQGLAKGITSNQGIVNSAFKGINTDLGSLNVGSPEFAPNVGTGSGSQGGDIHIAFNGTVDLSSNQKIDDVANRLARQLLTARAGSF